MWFGKCSAWDVCIRMDLCVPPSAHAYSSYYNASFIETNNCN